MIFEIEGEEAVAATEDLLALDGVEGTYRIPEEVQKGALTTVATIVGLASGAMAITDRLIQWREKYLKSDTASPRLTKVLIIDDQGNRLLLKSATAAQIQAILKALE